MAAGPGPDAPKLPKLTTPMDTAEKVVLAYMTFPTQGRAKLRSRNSIERQSGGIKRRTAVVGTFPTEVSIRRSVVRS